MPLGGAAIMGAATIGGSLLGGRSAKKAAKAAAAESKRQYDYIQAQLEAIGIPDIEAQKIMLQDPQLVGELIPELGGAAMELSSKMGDIAVDPRLKDAQLSALDSLGERAEGGLTPEDVIELRNIRQDATAGIKGQDSTILQNMEQRGLGGGGAELQMRLAAKQDAERSAAEAGDRQAAMNYQAKMDAIQQMGNLAGNMRGQEFGEQAGVASAQDSISRFNVGNRQRDVDRSNVAQAGNLQMRQGLESARVGNRNQEEIQNKGLIQRKFDNEMTKVGVQAGVATNRAQDATQRGANAASNAQKMWSGIGQAVGGIGKAAGGSSDKKVVAGTGGNKG